MKGFRKERVGELLLSFLAQEIRQFGDPRLGLITLTDIDVSPDLKSARIYWSSLSSGPDKIQLSDKEQREVAQVLTEIARHLKRRIGEELELRYIPDLHFRFDDSFQRGARIDELLWSVRKQNGEDA